MSDELAWESRVSFVSASVTLVDWLSGSGRIRKVGEGFLAYRHLFSAICQPGRF